MRINPLNEAHQSPVRNKTIFFKNNHDIYIWVNEAYSFIFSYIRYTAIEFFKSCFVYLIVTSRYTRRSGNDVTKSFLGLLTKKNEYQFLFSCKIHSDLAYEICSHTKKN